ncbi:outer membrane lipoprotein carrier protein LolA [candidate division KSB1 bacterium]|nr:outer membrane lipoprotein carrier protein LolA [candidate division KSB1 bacterium]
MKIKALLSILILVGNIAVTAADKKAEKILNDVKEQYEQHNQLCADYEQTFIWKLAGETQTVEGRICIKNQKKFFIETPTQTIIVNGETVWTVNKVNKQVIIDRASEQNNDNPFLKNFIDGFIRDYDVELNEKGDRENVGLTLTAKTEDQFIREIQLLVTEKTNLLSRIDQTDVNGNRTIYDVKNIDTGLQLSDDQFVFHETEGYEIVDMR